MPAQRCAGVTKTCGGSQDSEKESLRRLLDYTASQLDDLTEALRRDVVRLCWQTESETSAKLLADTTMHLNVQELLALQKSLRMRLAPADSRQPAQLSAQSTKPAPEVSAYRMQGRDDAWQKQ